MYKSFCTSILSLKVLLPLRRQYFLQELILPDDDAEPDSNLGILVDKELASTGEAIGAATKRIQKMLDQNKEKKDAEESLEVNQQLLNSCKNFMEVLQDLIGLSNKVLIEIVKDEMVGGINDYLTVVDTPLQSW